MFSIRHFYYILDIVRLIQCRGPWSKSTL